MLLVGVAGGEEVREKPDSARKLSDSSTVELFRELFSPPGPTWGPNGLPVLASPEEIPSDLLVLDGEGWARVPRYELRYREIRRPLSGISGHMYPAQLARLMEYLLTVRLEDLAAEQPKIRWRLVGTLVVEGSMAKAVVVPTVGGTEGAVQGQAFAKFSNSSSWDNEVSQGSKVPLAKPPVSARDQRDQQIVIQMAFACLDPSPDLEAPEHRHQGTALPGVETPMAAYIKSGRKLSKLPMALLKERENAARVRRSLDELDVQSETRALDAARARVARVSAEEMNALISTLGMERAAAALGVTAAALEKLAVPHSKPRSKGAAKDE